MIQLGQPFAKSDILHAWTVESATVGRFFDALADDAFWAAPPGIWSPADNLVHLIKSCSPVGLALKLPKPILGLRFGTAKRESRSFAAIRTAYVDGALAGGGVASGDYLPEVREVSPAAKGRISAKWLEKAQGLERALTPWSEAALDRYQVPHPLLGLLTVREILFFTLYHTMHHVNDAQRLLSQSVTEWFDPAPQPDTAGATR